MVRLGKIRLIRLQQEPCHLLLMGSLSDSFFESELPVRVYGCRLEPKFIEYCGYHEIHGRM